MKISVITVVLNAVKTIERTIKSVLSQKYENIEFIVIDGGSTDGTLDVIAKYQSHLSYFVSEPDDGIYDAMNKGIKKATGDLIGLLNADDWYEPEVLQVVADAYKRTSADIIYGRTFLVDSQGIKRLRKDTSIFELWRGSPACSQAIFISKKAYNSFGLYDTRYKIASDYDLLNRMLHNGAKAARLETPLVNYSTTGVSSTFHVKCSEEQLDITKKYIDEYPDKKDEINFYCKSRIVYAKAVQLIESCPDSAASCLSQLWIENHSCIIVWGTGVWGNRIANLASKSGLAIDFFLDSDPKKKGQIFCGVEVKSPDILENYEGTVFIAVKDYDKEISDMIATMKNPKVRCILLRDFIDAVAKQYDKQFL